MGPEIGRLPSGAPRQHSHQDSLAANAPNCHSPTNTSSRFEKYKITFRQILNHFLFKTLKHSLTNTLDITLCQYLGIMEPEELRNVRV